MTKPSVSRPAPELTTGELAAALGVTPRRVLQLASSRGVRPVRTIGRCKMWPAEASASLRPRVRGYRGHAGNQR